MLACLVAQMFFAGCHAIDFHGAWEQGGMLLGQAPPDAQVWVGKRRLNVTPAGRFVFGLDRDAPASISLKVLSKGKTEVLTFSVGQRQYAIQRVDGVPEATVTPPAEVLDRIRREITLIANARADADRREDFLRGFHIPLEGRITGVYGSQRIYNGVPRNPHFGLDIAAPTGTLVRAPAAGVVKLAEPDLYFSGGTLILDHGYGLSSTFIHLSEILVAAGTRVHPGDAIARVGATGRATGPHLDWRMNWFDVRVDPALVLKYFPAVPAR
jgi:murein DD-endopeptidase MepM/ murein hydrolase activator NlpD